MQTITAILGAFALLLFAAASGPAQAQDCKIRDIDRGASIDRIRLRSEANFKCLEIHIDALRAAQRELRAEIKTLKAGATPAKSMTAFRDVDGAPDQDGRLVGPVTFVLSGDRGGKPTSLEIEDRQLEGLCADEDGCLGTLGLEGVVIDGEQIQTRFARGPCNFHIDAKTGTWALSGLCATEDLPSTGVEPEPANQGAAWGRDGDAVPLGNARQDGRIILAFANACFLAESLPQRPSLARREARLQPDARRDLYLVTTGSEWALLDGFPREALALGLTDLPFRCRLTIRD
ncbi:MAG: hypothetical protein OEN23_17230 [Paracoccaceae bacterium]|nr:hypothetical protein [Paracoccaceae bacterium]